MEKSLEDRHARLCRARAAERTGRRADEEGLRRDLRQTPLHRPDDLRQLHEAGPDDEMLPRPPVPECAKLAQGADRRRAQHE